MFANRSGATKSDMQRLSSKSISVSQSPTASQELEQLNLGNLPLPLFQKTPDVHEAEHDRLQLAQGTLNVDFGCILPAIVVPVQHDVNQRRVKELGLHGFWCVDGVLAHETFGFLLYCEGFTLERRIDSGFAVLIIVLLILDIALLAALHELLEGGLSPTAALEELFGLRHCQVPCAKIVNTRVEVDFLWKFVSLLLKPQMFLDRRFSTHCWDKRGPDETHGSHEKNGFDDKSTIHKDVESRVQNRCGCTAQNVARFRAHLSNGHTVEYVWQDAHTGASPRNKQKDHCQTMGRWSQVSRFGTTGNRQSSERLHKNQK